MAQRKKRKKQTLRQKRLSNIRQNIRRMEKRGYEFPTGYYEDIKKLDTRKLGKIKPADLYEVAGHIISNTGEWVQGTEYRQLERKWSALKGQATRQRKRQRESADSYEQDTSGYYPDESEIIYDNVNDLLDRLKQEPVDKFSEMGHIIRRKPDAVEKEKQMKNMLQNLLREKMQEDPQGTAERIKDRIQELGEAVDKLTYHYDDSAVQAAGDLIADIISGGSMSMADRARYAEYTEEYEEI